MLRTSRILLLTVIFMSTSIPLLSVIADDSVPLVPKAVESSKPLEEKVVDHSSEELREDVSKIEQDSRKPLAKKVKRNQKKAQILREDAEKMVKKAVSLEEETKLLQEVAGLPYFDQKEEIERVLKSARQMIDGSRRGTVSVKASLDCFGALEAGIDGGGDMATVERTCRESLKAVKKAEKKDKEVAKLSRDEQLLALYSFRNNYSTKVIELVRGLIRPTVHCKGTGVQVAGNVGLALMASGAGWTMGRWGITSNAHVGVEFAICESTNGKKWLEIAPDLGLTSGALFGFWVTQSDYTRTENPKEVASIELRKLSMDNVALGASTIIEDSKENDVMNRPKGIMLSKRYTGDFDLEGKGVGFGVGIAGNDLSFRFKIIPLADHKDLRALIRYFEAGREESKK